MLGSEERVGLSIRIPKRQRFGVMTIKELLIASIFFFLQSKLPQNFIRMTLIEKRRELRQSATLLSSSRRNSGVSALEYKVLRVPQILASKHARTGNVSKKIVGFSILKVAPHMERTTVTYAFGDQF